MHKYPKSARHGHRPLAGNGEALTPLLAPSLSKKQANKADKNKARAYVAAAHRARTALACARSWSVSSPALCHRPTGRRLAGQPRAPGHRASNLPCRLASRAVWVVTPPCVGGYACLWRGEPRKSLNRSARVCLGCVNCNVEGKRAPPTATARIHSAPCIQWAPNAKKAPSVRALP